MEELCKSGAKGWWRNLLCALVIWIVPALVMLILAFAGPFLAAQVLAVCGFWSCPFLLHACILVLERSFWHYCERASSSAEHAKEQFQTLLGNFEAGIGMCVGKSALDLTLFSS